MQIEGVLIAFVAFAAAGLALSAGVDLVLFLARGRRRRRR